MFTLYTYTQIICDECGATTNIAPGKIKSIEINCDCKPLKTEAPKKVRKPRTKKVKNED